LTTMWDIPLRVPLIKNASRRVLKRVKCETAGNRPALPERDGPTGA
jgi:hypothetical protein